MAYSVKEIFYTLQGEGMNVGRPAVFCRFAGCNLWSGREEDRTRAVCRFCDTDFVGTDGAGGGRYDDARSLGVAVQALAPESMRRPLVVLTGGEPALQLDQPLLDVLHEGGFEVAIETNGTIPLAARPDWICVSPKAGTRLEVTEGDELKLVYRQERALPAEFEALGFRHFLLQPMDGPERERFTRECIAYCRRHPTWRLSLQVHKILGIP